MQELVMSEEEIQEACKRIGKELTETLKDEKKPPLFVCVLKGAANFMIDLIRNVNREILTDYIQISSYEGEKSTGKIRFLKDLSNPDVHPDTIVIVEDIIDTGLSMSFLVKHFQERYKPKRILVVVLLDKKNARLVEAPVDYVGKTLLENKFVVGYGLDYNELERNVPYIYVPTAEEVKAMDETLLNQ